MEHYVYVVMSNPKPGREDEYNRWYTDQHLSDVLSIPGFYAAQRFQVGDQTSDVKHRYMAVYEIKSADIAGTMQELADRARDGRMVVTDAVDIECSSATLYKSITPRVTA